MFIFLSIPSIPSLPSFKYFLTRELEKRKREEKRRNLKESKERGLIRVQNAGAVSRAVERRMGVVFVRRGGMFVDVFGRRVRVRTSRTGSPLERVGSSLEQLEWWGMSSGVAL